MANRSKIYSETMSSRIRALRIFRGFTQKDLSQLLFRSESAVRMWELGKSEPDAETIGRMAEIFNVSTDYLMGRPFRIRRQMSEWHPSLVEEYNHAKEEKDYLLFKFGLGYFEDHSDTENEKPTVVDDELSEGQKALIQFAKTVPDDKAEFVLKLMRTALEAD